jgi:gliding motility-associated-like protein
LLMRLVFSWFWLLLFSLVPIVSGAQTYVFAQLNGNPINTTGWNLQGNAYVSNVIGSSAVILTNPLNNKSGAIFYNQPINLGQCTQWTVEFDFRMYDGTMADGIAFCFLDVPPVGFVNGGGLGIPGTANGLKVCFDTYNNCGTGIVPKVEIRWGLGYDECWAQPTIENMGFIRSPNYNRAKIHYNAGVMSVYINNVLYLTGNQTFNFTGYFGFTASTGGSYDLQSIKDVVVYTNMPPSEAGLDKTFCSGETISIGTTPNLLYNYQWYPSTGLSSATVANPQVTLVNTGVTPIVQTYFVSTSFSSGTGCPTIDSVKVIVLPAPNITINSSATNVCSGTPVNFWAVTSNSVPNQVFQWMLNGSPVGSGSENFSTSSLNSGDVVTCILSGSTCGADTSNAINISINGNTTPEATITASELNICKGSPVVFTASGTPASITNYQWKKNGVNVGTNQATWSDNTLTGSDIIQCELGFSGTCLSSPIALSNSISIQVEIPPQANLGTDKGFCPGGSQLINAGNYDHYLWNNGATSSSITVNTPGVYSVIAYSALGCPSYDTIVINQYNSPVINLGSPAAICLGGNKVLDAGLYSSYSWNSGDNTRTISVSTVGTFSVQVTDANGCTGTGSTSITSILPLPENFLPEDTAICSYGSLEIKPVPGLSNYLWSTNETSPKITVLQPGVYWLQASDANNCSGVDSVVVLPKDCLSGFYVPAGFTPNADGKNDVFRPLLFGNVKKYRFIVFNRWGNIVFESSELMKGWDGTIRGIKQASAVFIWSCTFQMENEPERTEKGTVVLVR